MNDCTGSDAVEYNTVLLCSCHDTGYCGYREEHMCMLIILQHVLMWVHNMRPQSNRFKPTLACVTASLGSYVGIMVAETVLGLTGVTCVRWCAQVRAEYRPGGFPCRDRPKNQSCDVFIHFHVPWKARER